MRVSLKTVLDTRRALKAGLYRIRIKILLIEKFGGAGKKP
jgi:hypothetical protein